MRIERPEAQARRRQPARRARLALRDVPAHLGGRYPTSTCLRALNRGLLPGVYTRPHYRRSLAAYVRDYLTQEVFNEALTRNAAAFTRFFEALRFCHGELLNYASIARDCGVDAKHRAHVLRDTTGHAGSAI